MEHPNQGNARADGLGNLIVGIMKEIEENDVWEAYRKQLYRFIVKRIRDESLAEDLVHDVLLKAYAQKNTLKDPGKLRPWLYQITRNSIVDTFRSNKPLDPLPAELSSHNTEQADTAQQELSRCLTPLIKNLPRHYREPLELVEIKGLKQREMAAELGLTLSGAKSRVQRARKLLATALLSCCQVEFDRRGSVLNYHPQKNRSCC